MRHAMITLAIFGATAWAEDTSSTSSESTSATSTTADSSTITGTQITLSVGASSSGPAEVAFKYCFPTKFPKIATDTPCYSMEVLNQACFYGPSVFQTATATPTSSASPKEQQNCYCNEAAGVGYMYFQYMEGCSSCFREHGALGSYGTYNKGFISSLSKGYCGQSSPTKNFGAYLTSYQANKVTPTIDASTSNVLGTQTDVSLYFTTHLTGIFANATSNSTGSGTGTGTGTAGPTAGLNTTSSDSSTSTNEPSSSSRTTAAATASSSALASSIHVGTTGLFGALLIGLTAILIPYAALSLNTFILEGTKSPKTAASRTKNQGGSNRTILNRFNTSSPTRSSSPAKRSRSEMEVSNEGEGGETTTEDTGIASSIASESPQNHDDTEQRPASKKISRNSRDISVDMLAEETIPKLNQNIYQTPQSDSSTSSSGPSSNAAGNAPIVIGGQGPTPSLEEQIAIVTKAVRETLVDGAKGYVISNKWLTEAQERGTNTNKSGKEVKNHVQPPLDNRDLIDTSLGDLVDADGERFVPLKVGLVIDRDIQILPESAWKQIVQWHGVLEDSPDIIRWCHNTSEGDIKNLQYELNPPIFTLVKLAWFPDVTTKDAMAQKNLPPIRIVASRHERVQIFVKRAKSVARVENSAIRLWTTAENVITSLKNAGMPTPAQSRSASPAPGSLHAINIGNKLVLDLKTFTELPDGAAQLADIKDETNNANYNGRSNLDTFGLARPGVLIIEEQIGGPAGGEWISEASKTTLAQLGISKISASTLKPNSSGRSSPAPGGIMTRGRAKRSGRSRGVVGLSNLGNTCYMNAALQCVRAIKELTYYFVEDKYKVEINSSNPLGYGGDIAKVYASLLKEIYAQGTTSVSPRQFKSNVSKNAPTFSGYSQQDSQEFLGWLLDALQEDLNRIQKKPYVEKPDSTDEMVDDPNKLREFADHCWNIYKARNDSVITDLFAGMYKSTLHCPACDKVSIIFDPWSNLTLQLPLASAFHHNVHFFPVTGRPISVEIDIPQNTTFFGFKEYIAKKFNSDPKRLVAAESFSGKIWKLFDDRTPIAEDKPTPSDYVAFYELEHVPTNYPSKTIGQRSMLDIGSDQEDLPPEENIDECIAIPVFQRKPKGSRGLREPIGCPFVISLTRRDLVDEDEIMRAVLTKLNTLTTKDFLSDDEESPEGDEDTMVISASDVDSGSDSKIKAASLQSEEDFVDINSFPDKPVQNGLRTSYPARDMEKRSKTHPKVLERKEFIDNSLRNLFSIEIFSEGTASYPKCWQALNDDSRKYAQLADRIYNRDQGSTKITTSNKQQLALALANNGTPDGSEDELTTDEITPARSDSIEEEEGVEQDSRVNVIASGVGRPNGFKRLNNGPKTYSKKAQRRQTRRNGSIDSFDGAISEPDDVDDAIEVLKPALLRAGEALILEWSLESWKHVYGDNDEFATYGLSERIHPDPEAAERRRLRERKTKDGVTLEECLDELEKEEILSEADAWFCPRCKLHRRASKKFELWAVPDILIIHLKRFTTNGRNKLGLRVDFPLEGLDMSKRVTAKEDGRDLIYDLIAVDNHFGGLGGGHYTALAQNFEDGRWYDFNDSMASLKSDPATQFSNAAYILFYRRRSTTPLGGPRFKDLFTSIDESIDQADGCSVSSSRADSPSGEGQRLEDSSRGFSSAYQEVGVVHQAGNGGLQDIQRVTTRNMVRISQDQVDDDPILPDYDEARHPFPTMEIDDPALISTIPRWNDSNWSFGALPSNQSSNRADDDYSMTGNDAYSDRGHNLVLADGLFGRSNYSGQPGTPDDDNDSMHVGADADSDIEHLEDEGTDIKVIDSSHASRNWGGGHDDAERDEEDVHEIHA